MVVVSYIEAMTSLLHALRECDTKGIELLHELHQLKHWDYPAVFSPTQARAIGAVGEMLFGSTKFTRRQRDVVQAATEHEHSLSVLVMIHKHAKNFKAPADRWHVWETLVSIKGSFDQINAQGHALVASLSPDPGPPPVSLSARPMDNGMVKGNFCLTTEQYQNLNATLTALQDDSEDLPLHQAQGKAFGELLSNTTDGKILAPELTLVVTATDKEASAVARGEGDEMIFSCSDGTYMTGQDLANKMEFCRILGGVFDKALGGVSLHPFRFASENQRILLAAENMCCVFPGCSTPADRCQPHHIQAFKHGGLTEITNLTLLCKYHNGRNDDDPGIRLNGRIEKRGGLSVFIPPYPHARPRINDHQRATLGAAQKLAKEYLEQ